MTKKTDQYVPINKGNYALDTDKRVVEFDRKLSTGWSEGYKDYRQQWTERAKTQSIRDYPLLVDIELASICNLKCPMCYTISDTFRQAVNTTKMEWDLFAKIIDEIGGKVPAIRLSLRGEATLNKNFVECIRYAKSKGIKEVSTLTHGFKLNEKFTAEIIEAGIDWITISVDGLNETYMALSFKNSEILPIEQIQRDKLKTLG